MPLAAISRYAELVRQGTGNEQERLVLLRQHQERVTAQITALTTCLDMITFKVKIYEEGLTTGTTDPIWAPPGAPRRPPSPNSSARRSIDSR